MTVQREPAFTGAGLPVEIPHSRYFDFKSRITGGEYRIFVAIPPTEPPENGFAVLYALDGNSAFATTVQVATNLALAGEIRPAVIVGIGYPNLEPTVLGAQRFRDMATPASAEWIEQLIARVPIIIPGLTRETPCQVDNFLQVIEQEIKPAVAALVKVDPSDQAFVGHSLGGLTVLRALFKAPSSFRSFAAASPSIWWGNRDVLADEKSLAIAVNTAVAQPRIYLAVGGDEQKVTAAALRFYGSQANAESALQFVRMVDNTVELGQRLASLNGSGRFTVSTKVFADEDHMSVIPAVISRSVRFALRSDGSAAASTDLLDSNNGSQP